MQRQYANNVGVFLDGGGAVFNVKHPKYGVVGDGTTDDTAAIQAAINSVPANSTLFFPDGDYLAVTQLDPGSNIRLLGNGKGSKIFTNSDTVHLFRGTTVTNVVFQGLFLVGNGQDGTSGVGNDNGMAVFIDGTCADITIRHCSIEGFENAIQSSDTTRLSIDGCVFLKCSGAAWRALGCLDSYFNNCIVDGDRTGIGDAVDGINMVWLSQSSGVACNNVVVDGNVGRNFSFEGINLTRATFCSISNNVIDTALNGINLSSDSGDAAQPVGTAHNTISGNAIANVTTGGGIRIGSSSTNSLAPHHNVVVGNVVHTTSGGSSGIDLSDDASDNIVRGNMVRGSATHGISAGASADRNLISGNHTEGSTNHGILIQGGVGNVVQGNFSYSNTQDGIRVTGATASDTLVSNNVCHDNDSATGDAGQGIQVLNGTRTTLRGNRCFVSNTSNFQNRGILVSSTPTNTVIEDNDCRNNRNTGEGISNSDVTAVMRRNLGREDSAGIRTLADDATPSVAGGDLFKTGGTTTITDFDGGLLGQEIEILSGHAITITDGTNILLDGSVDFVMQAGDVLVLRMFNDQVWEEKSRKVN